MEAPWFRGLRFFFGILATAIAASMIVEAGRLSEAPFLGMSERDQSVGLVRPGGPAARAGLEAGDRILAVDGVAVRSVPGLSAMLRSGSPGTPIRLEYQRGGSRGETDLLPERMPPQEIAWGLAQAAAALIALFVGTMVVTRHISGLTTVFFLICLGLSSLLFSPYVPPASPFRAAALVGRTLMSSYFPALFLHFFLLFPYVRAPLRKGRWILAAVYLPSTAITLTALAGLAGIPRFELGGPIHGAASMLASATTAASFAAAMVLFILAYRGTKTEAVRRKLRVALWATVGAVLPIAVVIGLHALFPGREIAADRLSAIGLVLLPVGFGYAILKHGVFDIELLVKRSLTITGLTAILVLLYFLSYFLLRALLHTVTSLSGTLVSVLAFLFVILLFSPIRVHLQEIVDRSVYPERFESRRRLRELARGLPMLADEGQIVRGSLEAAARTLGIERGLFLSENGAPDRIDFSWGIPHAERKPVGIGLPLRESIYRRAEPVLREEIEAEIPYGFIPPDENDTLALVGARLMAPIATRSRRFGIVLFGRRAAGEGYSGSDIEILDALMSQTALAMEHAQFQRDLQAKEALDRELAIARQLQRQLLPQRAPDLPGLELRAATLPCEEVGGDYYDFLQTPDGRIAIAIGDVSGKGVPAALLMAHVQALFRAEARSRGEPDRVLDAMNRTLCEISTPDRFVSLFCALYDPAVGELRYSSAGHPPPMLVRSDGSLHHLEAASLLLGIQPEVAYPLGVVRLRSGDLILCYTDGIADPDTEGTSLREDQLEEILRLEHRLSANGLINHLLARIQQSAALEDDTTILVLKAGSQSPPTAS